jgi:hypothetical protein
MAKDHQEYEVRGEVIKLIHDEFPAVRWTCGGCSEDTATIFEVGEAERVVICEYCEAKNLVLLG